MPKEPQLPQVEASYSPEVHAGVRRQLLLRFIVKREFARANEKRDFEGLVQLGSFANQIGLSLGEPVKPDKTDIADPSRLMNAVRAGVIGQDVALGKLDEYFSSSDWDHFSSLLEAAGKNYLEEEGVEKQKYAVMADKMLETLLPDTVYSDETKSYKVRPSEFLQKMIQIANAGITLDWFGKYADFMHVKPGYLSTEVSEREYVQLIRCGILRDPQFVATAVNNVYSDYGGRSTLKALEVFAEAAKYGINLKNFKYPVSSRFPDGLGYVPRLLGMMFDLQESLAKPLEEGRFAHNDYNINLRLWAQRSGISFDNTPPLGQGYFDAFVEKQAGMLGHSFISTLLADFEKHFELGLQNPGQYKDLMYRIILEKLGEISKHDVEIIFTTGLKLGFIDEPSEEVSGAIVELTNHYTEEELIFGFARSDSAKSEQSLSFEDIKRFRSLRSMLGSMEDVDRFLLENLTRFGRLIDMAHDQAEPLMHHALVHGGRSRLQALMNATDKYEDENLEAAITRIRQFSDNEFETFIYALIMAHVEAAPYEHLSEEDMRFFIEGFGFNYKETMVAWKKTTSPNRNPDEHHITKEEAVKRNFFAMWELEKIEPGICKALQERFHIYDFARYPKEMLLDQYREMDQVDLPYIVLVFPRADWNNSYYSYTGGIPDAYDRDNPPTILPGIYRQFKEINEKYGIRFGVRIIEVDGRSQLEETLADFDSRYYRNGGPKIAAGILFGHGAADGMQFDGTEDGYYTKKPEQAISIDDAKSGYFDRIFEYFEHENGEKPEFILASCEVGQEEAFAHSIARRGAVVRASIAKSNLKRLTISYFRKSKRLHFDVEYDENDSIRIYFWFPANSEIHKPDWLTAKSA